jgi:cytoskeletal protein RodZ
MKFCWQTVCYREREPRMAPGGFVKKFLSLPSLAALAIALGMISWGSALNAQSTPSTTSPDATPSQQTPSTQQPPSPEMPPSSQQTPSSQSGSQSPDATAPSNQTPNSQSGSQSPDATTPRTQTPSSQSGSQSQTPDTTAPESGSRTGSANGAATGSAAGDTASGAQTFTGTVVKQGDKYVLKDDAGKTYDIDHQTDVAKFEGKRVRVQGTLDPSGKIMVK